MNQMFYEMWLEQVKSIAEHYNIRPADLLKMLYVNDEKFDYHQLYNNYDRYSYFVKFLEDETNNAK